MNYIIFISFFFTTITKAAEQDATLDSLGYKSAFEHILNKNLETVKSGAFAISFKNDKVSLYSVSNCSENYIKVDDAVYATDSPKIKSKLIDRYISYIDFSLTDKYRIPLSELDQYYLCFIENEDVTIFRYTGGENSRGGGPLYVIDSKNNKLLEVHYMQ